MLGIVTRFWRTIALSTLVVTSGAQFANAESSRESYKESYEEIELHPAFSVQAGKSYEFKMPGKDWRRLKKVEFTAYAYDNSCCGNCATNWCSPSSTVLVEVNGKPETGRSVNSTSSNYSFYIEETTDAVTIRNKGNYPISFGPLKVKVSERVVDCPPSWRDDEPAYRFEARNDATALAQRAIKVVDKLQGHVRHAEFGDYLLPIKKAAGDVQAAGGRGDLSGRVRTLLTQLKVEIEYAREFLSEVFEQGEAFELAVKLKGIGEEIEQKLH